MDNESNGTRKISFFRTHKFWYLLLIICIAGIWIYYVVEPPTVNRSLVNRQPTVIHVSEGQSVSKLAIELEDRQIIKSQTVLKFFLVIFKADRTINKGDYLFDEAIPVWKVAWMLSQGDHNIDPIRVTFREGITNSEMIQILSDKLQNFRKDLFLSDARVKQGYLFPDTYFFYPFTTTNEIIEEMTSNFTSKIKTLEKDILNSGHRLDDIITMASILEKEAKGKEDINVVSGILWSRISKGMPLQVDAWPDTYKNKGLPKEPIANPGLSSIKASIYPENSDYLFYLHGKDGKVHYAKTYSEHKININKYLK